MREQYSLQDWKTPIHAATTKPRHKFGIDGRLLLVPIIFPCVLAIPFANGNLLHQAAFAALAAVLWLVAKILWELNPYALDDFMAETKMPKTFIDDARARVVCVTRKRVR